MNKEIVQKIIEFDKCSDTPGYGDTFELFKDYDQELLVQICYNVNLILDTTYHFKEYPGLYESRNKALVLLEKWLKSDKANRDEMTELLDDVGDELYDTYVDYTYGESHYSYAAIAAYCAAYTSYIATGACDGDQAAEISTDMCCERAKAKIIIIKTVCEYYKMDYETFKALYL
jgi:hypothetical protein